MRNLALVALVLMFVAASCGGRHTVKGVTEDSPCPQWYIDLPQDPNFFFAAATAVSKDLQLAVEKAKTDARAEIAREMQTHIEGLTKKFDEEVGFGTESNLYAKFTQVSKSVVDQELMGTKVRYQHTAREGTGWRACVLMECSRGEANAQLVDKISKDEELYIRFRDSQAFKDLEKEVEAYREYKKEQGM